jgi:acetyltransferase
MGARAWTRPREFCNAAGIPTFDYPDTAARAFALMWRYTDNLRALYETPVWARSEFQNPKSEAGIIQEATTSHSIQTSSFGPLSDFGLRDSELIVSTRKAGRTLLTEVESKQLLSAYGIPAVETHVAFTEEGAVKQAERIGFPVAVKLFSETLTHKSDVGGVHLDVRNATGVRPRVETDSPVGQ